MGKLIQMKVKDIKELDNKLRFEFKEDYKGVSTIAHYLVLSYIYNHTSLFEDIDEKIINRIALYVSIDLLQPIANCLTKGKVFKFDLKKRVNEEYRNNI